MNEQSYYVYIHFRASDMVPFYVGKGKGRRAWNTKGRSEYWRRVFEKHGLHFEVCCESMSEQDAFLLEMWLVSKFRHEGIRLVNLTNGGEGVSGLKFKEEEITRRRDYAKGVVMSDATRRKISASKKGVKRHNMSSSKHPCYDHTDYTFINGDTIFIGSSYVLSQATGHDNKEIRKVARGARRVYKGWSLC